MKSKILLTFSLAISCCLFSKHQSLFANEIIDEIPLSYYLINDNLYSQEETRDDTFADFSISSVNIEETEEAITYNYIVSEDEAPESAVETVAYSTRMAMPEDVCAHNLFYSYMDRSMIKDKTSAQWQLQQSAYVSDYGIMAVDGFYLVAMGTKYADYVGQKFLITFEDGTQTKVMIGDVKQDAHTTNGNACTGKDNNDLIEIIIDSNSVPVDILSAGSFHNTPLFPTLVSSIEEIL